MVGIQKKGDKMKQRDLFSGVPIATKASGALDLSKIRKPLTKNYSTTAEDVYAKARSAAEAIKILRPDIEHELVTNSQRLYTYLQEIKREGIVAIDTETSDLDIQRLEVAGISLYTWNSNAIYVPVGHHFYDRNIPKQDVVSFLREIKNLADTGEVKVIQHNSRYDVQVLMRYSGEWIHVYADTLVAGALLEENEPHGLKYLWNKYCMQNRYSGEAYNDLFENRKYNTFDPEQVYIYATLDAVMTLELWNFQEPFMTVGTKHNTQYNLQDVAKLFWNDEMPIIRLAAEMQWEGIGFDSELNLKLHREYEAKLKAMERPFQLRVEAIVNESTLPRSIIEKVELPINPHSAKQMQALFYEIMGFELDESTKKQIIRAKIKSNPKNQNPSWMSVGDVAMTYLKKNYEEYKELFEDYEDIKATQKAYTGFIVGLRNQVSPITGRIHGGWNSTGTVTGRFSSQAPNLQNIPSRNGDIKPMFVPDDGKIFIAGDYSSQEPRVLAELSKDPILVQTFEQDKDIYSVLISLATGRTYDECTKDYHAKEMEEFDKKEQPLIEAIENSSNEQAVQYMRELDNLRRQKPINYRNRGKLLLLAVMYGLGADSLSYTLGIGLEEAKDLLERLHNELQGVRDFEKAMKDFVRKTGYLTMIGGRRRRFPNYALPELTIKHPSNAPIPQATIAYIQKSMEGVWKYNERRDMINVLKAQTNLEIIDNRDKRGEDETRILNSAIQGSSATMTKKALIYLRNDERLAQLNPNSLSHGITLQIHDEVVIQVPKEHVELGKQILQEAMERAAKDSVKHVKFKVEPEVMERWEAD